MEEHATRKRIYGNRFRGPGTELTAKTVHVMLLTLAEVFRVRESNIFIRESFAKVEYYRHYCIYLVESYQPLPPGVRQEKGTG
jgi:hypothetical protein